MSFSKLEKDFIRYKVLSVFSEANDLRIRWSDSRTLEDRWVLMINYKTFSPTQRLIRGSDITCPNFSIIQIKEMITVKKEGFILWQRENKLKKILPKDKKQLN